MNLKKSSILAYATIWLLATSIGLYVRLYPLRVHTSGNASEQATMMVIANLKTKIMRQVNTTQPQLQKSQKNILINKLLNQMLHKEKTQFHDAVNKLAKELSRRLSDNRISEKLVIGQPPKKSPKNSKSDTPYLLASDSFYYYGLTQNLANTGTLSDTIKGSKYLNKQMLAPEGHWEPFTLHPYVGHAIYRALKIFVPDITLMFAVSFTPLIITALALIPFLYLCRHLGCHLAVSFTSSIFFLLSNIFIKRSLFGWYDNDPYNILFPLLILAALLSGLGQTSRRRQYSSAIITALLMMLYALFWQGWVLMFAIIFISGILMLLYNHFILKEPQETQTRTLLTYLGTILIGSFITITLVFGMNEFFTLFLEGWIALRNFLTPQLALWPDLYISVSELHSASLSSIINLTGGPFFFAIAMTGVSFTLIKTLRQPRTHECLKIIPITIFLIITLIITCGAQRFAMLCLVPLSLFFSLGLQDILNFLQHKKYLDHRWIQISFTFMIIALTIIPLHATHRSIRSLVTPLFNETWEQVLTKIRQDTPKNSIINTWWPPGHFIKSMAHRRVTFDGASINVPQAYWIANVFLSQTEEEALGILRMLNNSANQAADYLHQDLNLDLSFSIQILKEITAINESTARTRLMKPFKKHQVDHLLNLTHKTPPPSYLLIYKEFVENNLQLKFIGNWNFKAIEKINKSPQRVKDVPARNSDEYVQFLWKLAGGAYKYSGVLSQLHRSEEKIVFRDNVRINLKTMGCTVASKKYGTGIPQSLFHIKNNHVVEKKFTTGNLPFSIILFEKQGQYSTVLLDRPLAKSLFVQLYFFEGKGLKYFQPFTHANDLTARTEIYVYKIDWEKFNKNRN